MKRIAGTVAITLAALAAQSHAALSVSESFDTPGALAGSNGGSGFAGAWASPSVTQVTGGTGNATVAAGSMTYSSLGTQGGKLELDVTKAAMVSITRSLTTPIVSNSGGTVTQPVVYLSILMSPSQTVEAWRSGLGFRLDDTTNNKNIQFDANYSSTWRSESNMAYGTNSGVAATTDTFVVMRFTPGAWSVTGIDYWVNPSAASLGTASAPTPMSSGSTNQGFSFTTVTMYAQLTSDGLAPTTFKGTFDEFRIGSTWADVTPVAVPEPAALATLAGAGLLVLRRKRA